MILLFSYDNLAIMVYTVNMNNLHEFEFITDKTSNFKTFVNVLKYRTPHIHLDYEIGMILFGELTVKVHNAEYHLEPGDILCLNPCELHEYFSPNQATLLLIQVNPAYFHSIYPAMQNTEFAVEYAKADFHSEVYMSLRRRMYDFANIYMQRNHRYELKCAGVLDLLFVDLLDLIPCTEISSDDRTLNRTKADRIRRIANYIENNYADKIKLSDLSQMEGITDTHMSHFFTDNFHMSFQEYMTKLRCEKARSLLLTTDLSLFDISYSCGFSDPKYFNKGFSRQYNVSPRQYRLEFGHEKLDAQQASMLTTQQILSDRTSLVLLNRYMNYN